jgi:allantoinase
MPGPTLVIRAPRVVLPTGESALDVVVEDGTIAALEAFGSVATPGRAVALGTDEVLMAGVVDTHVHVNEPGRTEWEGFASATRAAAAGGVTTVVDMPLNSIPPTVDVEALEAKRAAACGQVFVDVGFWGGAVPGNTTDLKALHDAGVLGFKAFLVPSGVDEFGHLDAAQLETAMREIASFGGLLLVHAEDGGCLAAAPPPGGASYPRFLASRPAVAEHAAVRQVVEASRRTGCRVHVVHVSSGEVLPLVASARRDGVPVTAETCPHYLAFAAEEIPAGATYFKCCPPIREGANRDRLWEGLRAGTLDMVVSDHSPSTADLKRLDTGDFGLAWGGISSLQLGLPAVWTQGRRRGFGLADVSRWMSQAPALLAGLPSKGRIAVGRDADLCAFAPDEEWVVDPATLQHRNPLTPYAGRTLTGVVRRTWLRGVAVDTHDEPHGRLLTRGAG